MRTIEFWIITDPHVKPYNFYDGKSSYKPIDYSKSNKVRFRKNIVENNTRQHEYLGLIHNHVGNHYLFSKLDMYNAIKIALYLYQKYHIRYFFNLLYCEEKIKINLFDVKIKKVFSMDYIHFSIENYKVISFEEYIKVIKTGR